MMMNPALIDNLPRIEAIDKSPSKPWYSGTHTNEYTKGGSMTFTLPPNFWLQLPVQFTFAFPEHLAVSLQEALTASWPNFIPSAQG